MNHFQKTLLKLYKKPFAPSTSDIKTKKKRVMMSSMKKDHGRLLLMMKKKRGLRK